MAFRSLRSKGASSLVVPHAREMYEPDNPIRPGTVMLVSKEVVNKDSCERGQVMSYRCHGGAVGLRDITNRGQGRRIHARNLTEN